MNDRRMTGAVIGGLIAGLGLTAMMMAGERKSGEPSELTKLERAGARELDIAVPAGDVPPGATEQAIVQGGHLLLSAAAGVAFATVVDEDAGVIPSGIGFGLAFYAAMHWLAGPLLGVKEPEWRAGGKTIGMHTINHLGFGLATALGARLADRRPRTN